MGKKLIAVWLTCVVILSALAGCAKKEGAEGSSGSPSSASLESSEAGKEEGDSKTGEGTLYHPDFSIEQLDDGIKRVVDGEDRELILVPKALSKVPDEYAKSMVVRTPVERAVFLSTTQACTFRTVDDKEIVGAICGVSGGVEEWKDVPAIKEGIEKGNIANIGGIAAMEPDYERIQSLNPDIVFVQTGSNPQTAQIEKFEEMGIQYAVDNEYMEDYYLARMEWMRFILTFFNADTQIEKIMDNAKKTVDAAKEEIKGRNQPKVAVFSVYDGAVYGTHDDSWVGTMLSDMGGVNAFAGMGEGTLTMEAAYACVQDADIIIYSLTPAYCDGMAGIMEAFPQLGECKAYKNDAVYQYEECFWTGIDQSDVMAVDLAAVLYPDVFSGREIVYYKKLEANTQ